MAIKAVIFDAFGTLVKIEKGVHPYRQIPDGQEAIDLLQGVGIKVGICSNLSMPYGAAVKRLCPDLDAYGFSYEIGVLKPDPLIYRTTCDLLQVEPGHFFDARGEVAMIGDSQRCDRDGPRAFGIKGFYLDRHGQGDFSNLVDFAKLVAIEMRGE